MKALLIVLAVLGAATLFGLWWQRRNGRVRAVSTTKNAQVLTPERIGTSFGARATFVQFSSEVCHPCRMTARVLDQLRTAEQGVVHVELDAAQHLDLVQALNVLRTPTVIVLGPDGHIVGRSSGAMTPAQARATLEELRLV